MNMIKAIIVKLRNSGNEYGLPVISYPAKAEVLIWLIGTLLQVERPPPPLSLGDLDLTNNRLSHARR